MWEPVYNISKNLAYTFPKHTSGLVEIKFQVFYLMIKDKLQVFCSMTRDFKLIKTHFITNIDKSTKYVYNWFAKTQAVS